MKAINALRVATENVHRKLESAPLMSRMLGPDLSALEYTEHLAWWHELWSTLESVESALRPENASELITPQPRAYKALADLQRLSAMPGMSVQPRIRSYSQPLELQLSTGSWLGLIYVMRGSELGNKVVLKHLKTQFFGTPISCALSFFESVDSVTPWPTFVKQLDTLIVESDQVSSATEAAVSVFKWFYSEATVPKASPNNCSIGTN